LGFDLNVGPFTAFFAFALGTQEMSDSTQEVNNDPKIKKQKTKIATFSNFENKPLILKIPYHHCAQNTRLVCVNLALGAVCHLRKVSRETLSQPLNSYFFEIFEIFFQNYFLNSDFCYQRLHL
jgi:hypothetical protein